MLHPARLNESKIILNVGLMDKYLKNSLQHSRTRLHIDKELYEKAKYGALS